MGLRLLFSFRDADNFGVLKCHIFCVLSNDLYKHIFIEDTSGNINGHTKTALPSLLQEYLQSGEYSRALSTLTSKVGRRLYFHPCLSVSKITSKVMEGFR